MKDVDTETLLNILKNTKDEKLERLNDVHKFILDCGIVAGTDEVPCKYIFLEYKRWAKDLNMPTLTKTEFFRKFCKFFKQQRTQTYRYYNLDKTPFLGYPEYVERLRLNETKEKRPEEKTG